MDWSRTLLVTSYLGNGEQWFVKIALNKEKPGSWNTKSQGRQKALRKDCDYGKNTAEEQKTSKHIN